MNPRPTPFRELFDRAEMIVAKGQGNNETLAGSEWPIHYLLPVKCAVIARDLQLPVGSLVLRRSP